MMQLLHILLPGAPPDPALGRLPGDGPVHRLLLDPAASLETATASVAHSLREHRKIWVAVHGRAAAPFLAAVGADLSLAVAGALILAPQPWTPSLTLDLSPLAFPSVLVAEAGDLYISHDLAAAWGATVLSPRRPGPLLSDPQVLDLIDRRERRLARV